MRNLRSVIFGFGCVLGGAFLVDYFGAEAGAQQQTVTEAQSWELTWGGTAPTTPVMRMTPASTSFATTL